MSPTYKGAFGVRAAPAQVRQMESGGPGLRIGAPAFAFRSDPGLSPRLPQTLESRPMRPVFRTRLLIGATAALASCNRATPGHVKLPQALSSALQGGAINAGGETPLWALQIRPSGVTFSSEKVASITLTALQPTAAQNGGVWTGVAGGRPFRALITAAACRDVATGLTYPLTAKVEALGYTYHGCSARAGQGLGPRT